MKTYEELQQENTELLVINARLKNQLTLALDEVARNHAEKMQDQKETKKRGEFHHRAFEQLCPAPDLSQITIFK